MQTRERSDSWRLGRDQLPSEGEYEVVTRGDEVCCSSSLEAVLVTLWTVLSNALRDVERVCPEGASNKQGRPTLDVDDSERQLWAPA